MCSYVFRARALAAQREYVRVCLGAYKGSIRIFGWYVDTLCNFSARVLNPNARPYIFNPEPY